MRPEIDRTAQRDLLIRIQTPLDRFSDDQAAQIVDFTLNALITVAREGRQARDVAEHLNVRHGWDDLLDRYGLRDFLRALVALPGLLSSADTAALALADANAAYDQRGWLYRIRARYDVRNDTLADRVRIAEDRIRTRAYIKKSTDPYARLAWAFLVLQTLRDSAFAADFAKDFVARFDLGPPTAWIVLDDPNLVALLDGASTMPTSLLTKSAHRLTRLRRDR